MRKSNVEVNRLGRDIVDLHGEMVLLENYSALNYTGIPSLQLSSISSLNLIHSQINQLKHVGQWMHCSSLNYMYRVRSEGIENSFLIGMGCESKLATPKNEVMDFQC